MTQVKQEDRIRISVTPEPTDEEMAVIAAVVTALAASSSAQQQPAGVDEDRWQRMGRYEALRDPFWPPAIGE